MLVGALLAWVVHEDRATQLDLFVDDLLVPTPALIADLLSPATELVGPLRVLAAGVTFSVLCLVTGHRRAGILVAVVPPAALLFTELVLKPFVDRPPVAGQGDAYPSGHATAVFALGFAVSLVLRRRGALGRSLGSAIRMSGLGAAFLVPVYLSFALVVFRHHYVTDVIGGMAVAMAATLMVALATDQLADRVIERRVTSKPAA